MQRNKVYLGDCTDVLPKIVPGTVDLIFADPPFNIGMKYKKTNDNKPPQQYKDWCRTWIKQCHKVLKRDGAIWIAINDENVANMYLALEEAGFCFRNWVVWFYAFGQNQRKKYGRCHTHILYFTMHKKNFTFNADPVRVPSARQTVYNDKRANPLGKVPDDVWTEYPRVCGSYRERNDVDHPCQMPEDLLKRVILSTSNPGDLVLDPFGGTGTTPVVAKLNGRDYMAIDDTKEHVAWMNERLLAIDDA